MMDTTTMKADRAAAVSAIIEAMQVAAREVLASKIANRLTKTSRENLARIVDGSAFGPDRPCRRVTASFTSSASVDLESSIWGSDCDMYVDFGPWGAKVTTNDDGSQVSSYERDIKVNWSSHGSTDHAVQKVRAEVYLEMCEICERIAEKTPEAIRYVSLTAEEHLAKLVADKKAAVETAREAQVLEAIKAVRSGMRVGSRRDVHPALISGLPSGATEHKVTEANGAVRKYRLDVRSYGAALTRIA